ncbi:MAG TPA: serine hydrolase domain-containing protein [Candidatus Tumulicola sp.]|jgi:CubicO group peptidase (beta-lactamase class C family)
MPASTDTAFRTPPRWGSQCLRGVCCLAAFLWGASSPATPQVPTSALGPDAIRKIDALIAIAMSHQHVPAVSVAIAKNGSILYARGYGYRDLTNRRPANADTIYNIGSVTKQFTAAAILLLQQEGKLSVNDSLGKYFPAYPYAKKLTLRNLLNQTSGIPDYVYLPNLPHHATAMGFFKMVWVPLHFSPGTRFEYSSTNYLVLGMIVEMVSGDSYGGFLAKHLFEPLGMNDSSTRVEPRELSNGAIGYTFDGRRIAYKTATPDDIGYGDATVNSSAPDLIRWDVALESGGVVDAASWKAMISPPVARYEPPYGGYGFGLFVGRLYDRQMIYHPGANPGFITYNATFPGDGLEIAILGNSDNFQTQPLFKRIFELVEPLTAAQIRDEERPAPNENVKVRALAKRWLARLQTGDIDRSQLSTEGAKVLTPAYARALVSNARAIGTPQSFVYRGVSYTNRKLFYAYILRFSHATVFYYVVLTKGGRIRDLDLQREDPALARR